MKTRVYSEKIELNENNIKDFWAKRACCTTGIKTVLLGDNKGAQEARNRKECLILNNAISGFKALRILDIGCGIGRWADNLYKKIESYTGIDFTTEYINTANQKFFEDKNITFYQMSVCDMKPEILNGDYNLIICTGVLMYINDSNIPKIFSDIKKMNPEIIYFQESTSLMDGRLTLDNFESKELKSNYSAIYRTQKEYEEYLKDFSIIETNLLLDDKTGGREETNARYWILKRKA